MPADVVARCDENYWETMDRLGTAVSGSAGVREDGLLLTSCRSPIPFFNSAFLLPGARRSTSERVQRAAEFYAAQNVPFVIRARRAVAPDLPGKSAALGLEEAGELPLMVLPAIRDVPAPPNDVEVRTVVDETGLRDHTTVVSSSFGLTPELAQQLFTESMIGMPATELFVAYMGEAPVATSLVSLTADMAGVYNVATLHTHRRRGLGAALTWWAVAAGQRAGAKAACLQASDMGRPVYERMGFHVVDDYLQFTGGGSR